MKTNASAAIPLTFTCCLLLVAPPTKAAAGRDKPPAITPAQNKACAECHRKNSPALVMEWERSVHFQRSVGCLDCHASEKGKPGAWLHEGLCVSLLVTPKDCSQCHEEEFKEFSRIHGNPMQGDPSCWMFPEPPASAEQSFAAV